MLPVAQVSLDTLVRMVGDPTIRSITNPDDNAALLEDSDFLLQDLPECPEDTMQILTTQPKVEDLLDLTTGHLYKLPMFDCGSLKQSYVNGKVSGSSQLKRRIHEELAQQEGGQQLHCTTDSDGQQLPCGSKNETISRQRERNMDLAPRKDTNGINSNQEHSVMTKTAFANPHGAVPGSVQVNKKDVRHTFEVCQKSVDLSKRNTCRNDTPNQHIHIHHHFHSHPCDTDLECQLHQKSDPPVDLTSGTFYKDNDGMPCTIREGVECSPTLERRSNATLVGHNSQSSEATLRLDVHRPGFSQNTLPTTALTDSFRGHNKQPLQQVQGPYVRDKEMLHLGHMSHEHNVHHLNWSQSNINSRNAYLKSDTFQPPPEKRSMITLQEYQTSEYAHMYSNYGNGFVGNMQIMTERVSTNVAYNLGQHMPRPSESPSSEPTPSHIHVSRVMAPHHSNSSQPKSKQGTANDLPGASSYLGRRPPPPLIPMDQIHSEQPRPAPHPSPNSRLHHPYQHFLHDQNLSFSNLTHLQNTYSQHWNSAFPRTVTPGLNERRTVSNHLQHCHSYPAM